MQPYWSRALRALREARGITQDGWAAQLGYGRATIRRWEAGATVPSADAEAAIIELCREKDLFRRFSDGPLAEVEVSPEWIAGLLASARLEHRRPTAAPATPSLSGPPPIRYALSGEVSIAYQVFGEGPPDLIVTPGAVSHREIEWEYPGATRFFAVLAEHARVIIFDKRGTGMSDRVETGTLEERVDDIRAVMDAAGVERATLFGISEGGPMSIFFAATYPERTRSLILYGAYAKDSQGPSQQQLGSREWDKRIESFRKTWGTPRARFLDIYGPSVADDPRHREWWARYLRMSASPGAVLALNRMNTAIDVNHLLPALRIPVLVLHRSGDRAVDIAEGRYLADQIPGAAFVELPGDDHLPWVGDIDSITSVVADFVKDSPSIVDLDRVLATILAARFAEPHCLPDAAARLAAIRHELANYRGREERVDGDTLLATFDGPSRAVRCAFAIRDIVPGTTVGIHTGEIEMHERDVAGVAIDVCRDIAGLARPGHVLVSRTVTDLVAGSRLTFTPLDMKDHTGPAAGWPLFRADDGGDR